MNLTTVVAHYVNETTHEVTALDSLCEINRLQLTHSR